MTRWHTYDTFACSVAVFLQNCGISARQLGRRSSHSKILLGLLEDELSQPSWAAVVLSVSHVVLRYVSISTGGPPSAPPCARLRSLPRRMCTNHMTRRPCMHCWQRVGDVLLSHMACPVPSSIHDDGKAGGWHRAWTVMQPSAPQFSVWSTRSRLAVDYCVHARCCCKTEQLRSFAALCDNYVMCVCMLQALPL